MQKDFTEKFGGQFVPETLMTAVIELDKAYREAKEDPSFQAELDDLLKNYVGRETPLYHAKRLTDHIGGAQIYLKREDLNHTGAHRLTMPLVKSCLPNVWARRKIIAENRCRSTRCCNSDSRSPFRHGLYNLYG
mgnify:CR=1 FL=1